jgi:hypothetical protein
LALVDRVGDTGVREGAQQVAVLLQEQQPDELQHPQREHERAHQQPVHARFEPSRGQQGQQQCHEEGRPQLLEHARRRLGDRGVKLTEQGRQEEAHARGRHELAAATVRAPAPCDEPAGGERPADQPVDHLHRLDGLLAREEDRHERAELGRDGERPEREPEAQSALGDGEAARGPGASGIAGSGGEAARHDIPPGQSDHSELPASAGPRPPRRSGVLPAVRY